MKRLFISLMAGLTVAVSGLVAGVPVYAQTSQSARDACQGIADTTGGSCAADSTGSINNILATVLNIFSIIVGIIAVIMIIVGGLKFITSAGDSNKATNARNTILFALIGLVVVALAQVLVRFVLSKAT